MKIRTRATLAVLAAVSASLTLSVPAAADPPNVPGFEVHTTSNVRTASPSSLFSTTASCTGAKKLIGVGWRIQAGYATGEVVVGEMDVTDHSVRVQGREDQDGFSNDWIPVTYATCIEEPVGYALVSNTSVNDSSDPKEASVDCPGGTVVLGTAFSIAGANGQANISSLQITGSDDSVFARAREDRDGTTALWALTAYGFCGAPPDGYNVEESSNQTVYPNTSEFTSCGTCKLALGGGFHLSGDDGDVTVYRRNPQEYPAYSGHWSGVTGAAEIPAGTADNWNLTDQIVCVDDNS
jgi:hypothetical protein